jgi:hypothetical protein
MTPLAAQFELLKTVASEATLSPLASGAAIIRVPNFALPAGWSKSATTIYFLAPVGYPFSKPDCFWADADLRLSSGGMPQSAQIQAIPETVEPLLWFSWHVAQWHPSRDTLISYFYVVKTRLKEAK